MPDFQLVFAGGVTGFLVGLTGVGGGALMTPLLMLIFGVAPVTAVGTDLWFAAITKLFATHIHNGDRLIDWGVARRMWLGSLPAACGSIITLRWLSPLGHMEALKVALAVAVIITALGILTHSRLHALGRYLRVNRTDRFKQLQYPLTVLAGAILGILVSLTSVGAGALGAVFLTYLYPLRLTPPRLVATDIVHAIPLAVFAGIGHLLIGNVDLILLVTLLLGSLPTVILGARLSYTLPQRWLRWALAVVLAAVAVKLLGGL